MTAVGSWQYSTAHNCTCKVIEEQTLWGQTLCRVWLPGSDSVVRIPVANLKPLEDAAIPQSGAGITYVAAAAKVADALTQDLSACGDAQAGVLLAPIESSVIPLDGGSANG